jgi:hypothetical protein
VDKQALIDFTNEKFLMGKLEAGLDFSQLVSLYWIYHNMGCLWNSKLLAIMENSLVKFVEDEILLQQQLEKERSEKTDDNLQSLALRDI